MPDLLYFIWALLPVIQLFVTMKASAKKLTNTGRREDPKHLAKALAFSVALFVLAIVFDKQFYGGIGDWLEDLGIDSRVPRWLIYPALLTASAVIQQFFIDKKRKEEAAEETARRLKYAKKKDF